MNYTPPRFQKIDELTIGEHYHIATTDDCYYVAEYEAGTGITSVYSRIKNLKWPEGHKNFGYKAGAIRATAQNFRDRFNVNSQAFKNITFVPVPPSKAKNDEKYDDRMVQILEKMGENIQCDVRELVVQKASLEASHHSIIRPTPDELYQNYEIVEGLVDPHPTHIMIVDDVLTAGSHFKAMQRVLLERFPGVKTTGIFYARRKIKNAAADSI